MSIIGPSTSSDNNDLADEILLTPAAPNIPGARVEQSEQALSFNTLENSVQERVRATYERVLSEKINDHLDRFLRKMIKNLEREPFSFMESVNQELDEANRRRLENFRSNRTLLSFEENRQLFNAFKKAVIQLEEKPEQAANRAIFHFAKQSFDEYSVITKFDIPKIIESINTIIVIKEQHHYLKQKKKSLFRRIIEFVMPFLKKNDQEMITQEVLRLSSLQKAATSFAALKIGKHLEKNAFQEIKKMRAQIKAQADQKQVQLGPMQEQATQLEAVKKAVPKISVLKEGYHFGAGISKGILSQVGEALYGTSVGAILVNTLEPDKEIIGQKIADHIEEEFSLAAQKEAFITLIQFAADLYAMHETIERANENHPGINLEYGKLGLNRISQPEFKIFLTSLARALGFKGDERQLAIEIHQLYYAQGNLADIKKAFYRFVNNQEAGLNMAVQVLTKEYHQLMEKKGEQLKESSHYLYLLDLNKELLNELKSASRIKNAANYLLKEVMPESEFYNPDAAGLKVKIQSHLKEKIITTMPSHIELLLKDAIKARKESQNISNFTNQNLLSYINNRLEKLYDPNNQSFVPSNEHTTSIQRELQWYIASKKGTVFFTPPNKKDYLQFMHKAAMSKWKKFSVRLLLNIEKAQQPGFFDIIYQITENEIRDLHNRQAHPDKIQALSKKLILLSNALSEDRTMLRENYLESLSEEELKSLLDVINQGCKKIVTDQKKLSLEQKSFIFMLIQAINDVNLAYNVPTIALKIYDDVYKTELDTFKNQKHSELIEFVFNRAGEKIQTYINSLLSNPSIQFEYLVKSMATHPDGSGRQPLTLPEATPAGATNYVAIAAGVVKPVGHVVSQGVVNYFKEKVLKKEIVESAENFNEVLVNSCQSYIREQAFDSMLELSLKMYQIYVINQRFQSSHQQLKLNPFTDFGLNDEKKFIEMLNKVAQGLGFEDMEKLYNMQLNIKILQANVEHLEAECATRRGWIYNSADLPLYEAKLEATQKEKVQAEKTLHEVRQRFAQLPQNLTQERFDSFVTLKMVIKNEYEDLTAKISKKDLKNSHNYVTLISSLNNIVSQVELVQRETLAVELLAPNMDQYLGFDAKAKGLWAKLKNATRHELQDKAVQSAHSGIFFQLQGAISQSRDFSDQLLTSIIAAMDEKLQTGYGASAAQDNRSQQQASLNFQFRNGTNDAAENNDESAQEPVPRPRGPRHS